MDTIELTLGFVSKVINLKISDMFIIGDNQGGNTICGCHIYYGTTAKRISRMCIAGLNQLSNLKIGLCQHFIMEDVINYVNSEIEEKIFKLYQVPHWVA